MCALDAHTKFYHNLVGVDALDDPRTNGLQLVRIGAILVEKFFLRVKFYTSPKYFNSLLQNAKIRDII